MKACAHCHEPMADAADRCPACGMGVNARVIRELREVDEPLGFKRDPDVLAGILLLLALLAVAGVVWFLK